MHALSSSRMGRVYACRGVLRVWGLQPHRSPNHDQQLKAHTVLQLTITVFSHTQHVPTYRLSRLGFVLVKCPLRSFLEESFSGMQPDRYSCLCTLFGLQQICEARSIFGVSVMTRIVCGTDSGRGIEVVIIIAARMPTPIRKTARVMSLSPSA
jgi:hypothetical protein